jgi:CheY-like chemotaxis protein/HPt (histidine-containing phosphotransfer) domain-containing protein
MGGTIEVASREGIGSVFHFAIPLPIAGEDVPAPSDGALDRNQPQGQPRPLRILVAEDHPINQEFASRALRAAGHSVTLAASGEEAVAAALAAEYDVVLMDIQMPVLDGLQATVAIRRHEVNSTRRVPIVAMTAHAMAGDRDKCLAAGMDGYIVKPIRLSALYEAVQAAAHLPARQAADRAPGEEPFDRQGLLEAVGGDMDFLQRLLLMLEEDLPSSRQRIEAALAERDWSSLSGAAHSVKGVVKNFHALGAARAAEQLEQCGKQADLAGAAAAWRQLQSELEWLVQRLRLLVSADSAGQAKGDA